MAITITWSSLNVGDYINDPTILTQITEYANDITSTHCPS